jgi:hypothetical protein
MDFCKEKENLRDQMLSVEVCGPRHVLALLVPRVGLGCCIFFSFSKDFGEVLE